MSGIISSAFGEREHPIRKDKDFHNGIDIAADMGTAVVATTKGKVTEVKYTDANGNTLVYETDDGYRVVYAHLESILVKVGDTIDQKQVVATCGSTGISTGPHLHYTIYKGSELVNPQGFMTIQGNTVVS